MILRLIPLRTSLSFRKMHNYVYNYIGTITASSRIVTALCRNSPISSNGIYRLTGELKLESSPPRLGVVCGRVAGVDGRNFGPAVDARDRGLGGLPGSCRLLGTVMPDTSYTPDHHPSFCQDNVTFRLLTVNCTFSALSFNSIVKKRTLGTVVPVGSRTLELKASHDLHLFTLNLKYLHFELKQREFKFKQEDI